jgi:hypothetical protein
VSTYYEDTLNGYLNDLREFPENERGDIVEKAENYLRIEQSFKDVPSSDCDWSALKNALNEATNEIDLRRNLR